MAELDLTAIAATSIQTPASGVGAAFFDSTLKLLSVKDDAGAVQVPTYGAKNQSVTTPGAGFAADTYLVGSSINLGAISQLKAGSRYHCLFDVTKSAAGTATPILIVRFGTAGAVTDAAILTFTFNLQTAVADNGTFEIFVTFRTIGSGTSAVLQGQAILRHNLAITGLGSVNPTGWQQVIVTSSGFNSTPANSIIGVSVNGGASAAWTITQVQAEVTV